MGRYAEDNITDMNHVAGTFNPLIENKKLIVCNELKSTDSGKFVDSDKLKSIVTDKKIVINEKHVAHRRTLNVANFIFVSNNVIPLMMSEDDRRYVVIHVSDKFMQNVEHFEKLYETFTDEFYDITY
jgi:hypothetical protein